MASPAVDYARQNQQRFLNELKDLLRIPSVSTLEEHKSDVQKAADFVASELRRIGMENVEIIPTEGHPLVYADWLHAAGKPTVLCYGHYDVQPADPLELWESPPFEPAVAMATSTPAARLTTRARCTCTSRPWRRYAPLTEHCPST